MNKSWTTIFFIAISLLVIYIIYDVVSKSFFERDLTFDKTVVMINSSLQIQKMQKLNSAITDDFINAAKLQKENII